MKNGLSSLTCSPRPQPLPNGPASETSPQGTGDGVGKKGGRCEEWGTSEEWGTLLNERNNFVSFLVLADSNSEADAFLELQPPSLLFNRNSPALLNRV